jgi:lactate dehydrogenase-like 2-hydroxyacid dehydrogenase
MLPALEKHFEVHVQLDAHISDALPAAAKHVCVLVTGTLVGAGQRLINSLPDIEIIACTGGHVDRIDMAAARVRGIPVTNAPGISAPDVADLGLALILGVSRRLIESHHFVRDGRWPEGGMGFGRRVGGKKVGILGLGGIGRIIARRVHAFDMEVCYSGPGRKDDVSYPFFDDLSEMARHVDYLVVCCPESPQTRHLVDMPVLRALGPEGMLINIARGAIVDEAALIEALAQGIIAGAGLDVFEDEPHVPEALTAMDNVILQAHVGAFTTEAKLEMVDVTMNNLLNHFAGQPLPNPVG